MYLLEVYSEVNENGVATLTLNNPKALNSINLNMVQLIKKQLKQWENNEDILLIIMEGEGDRAFCAGGDIKSLYKANVDDEVKAGAVQFFEEEYELDAYIYEYPKPIIADLSGIVMGGGVGLSYHADYRIVSEKTMWAMPEMNLGFFPDVGAGYFLNKAPGHYGRYLALTGETINGKDAKFINAADYLIASNEVNDVLQTIKETRWTKSNLKDKLTAILVNKSKSDLIESKISHHEESINQHFSFNTVEEIVDSLEADETEFANETKKAILSKSPVSLKVALEQAIRSENKTLQEALHKDKIIAENFLNHADFYEGIRSVLIDKDRMPDYEYKKLSEVDKDLVESFFK